eukprot:Colp12_sorted_trinity150504_noHs@8805
MVLEATVVCLDNSEWMRNGDYLPTRMEAQHDAVNLICGSKTQQNPENTVSVLTMGGRAEVLVTLTTDLGKILTSLHGVKLKSSIDLINSIQVAQLALKHRQNKNQKQRVIVFVGSPVDAEEKELVKLGKKLKKNNVSVDIINFGEEAENTAKLEAFVGAVNNKEGTSHLITVPPGPHILSDILMKSPIVIGDDVDAGASFEFGVDPNMDPELALALRMSMEEEQERQRQQEAAQKPAAESAPAAAGGDVDMGDADDEQALLAQALAMSMQGASEQTGATTEDFNMNMQDPDFLSSVLGSLPGVDPNDERIKNALGSITKSEEKKDEDKDKDAK